ncbi:hypothetical protein [Mobiluncus mulieris]|uniref:hypothetical protein n=1 Tax=Mobiluncus mulieris TaxID=2052 RepID=UPI0012DC3245|nr:hypothetical protein [Mobiluncus mulieris]
MAMLLALDGCGNSAGGSSDPIRSDDPPPALESSETTSENSPEVDSPPEAPHEPATPETPQVTGDSEDAGDSDLQVTPSTGAMRIEGTVADIAQNKTGALASLKTWWGARWKGQKGCGFACDRCEDCRDFWRPRCGRAKSHARNMVLLTLLNEASGSIRKTCYLH